MSQARLAAEAAFAAPVVNQSTNISAVVIVRKTRRVNAAVATGAGKQAETTVHTTAAVQGSGDAAAPNEPRVFRIESDGPAGMLGGQDMSSKALAKAPETITSGQRRARRRSARPAHRPGPVVTVLAVEPRHMKEQRAELRLPDLLDQVAYIGVILDEAGRAKALRFVDSDQETQWEVVSRQADDLLAEIMAIPALTAAVELG